MNNHILKLENIHKYYFENKNKLHILNDLNLEIKSGEFISILGKSGSGKTTLLNILGLLDTFDDGNLYYDGIDIKELNEEQKNITRNKYLGFVFQFHYLLPEFTALENVILPNFVQNKNLKNMNNIKKRATELLEILELKDRLNHKPSMLSGGEKQRVAIARALINNPKILLADEPTGNLDEETSEHINSLFKKINTEFNQTIIVVTHSSELANVSQKRYHLRKGALVSN
ncbi:MAG: lipoprotein-releasing system ATP-binding protein [Fusobacteriaceae bacterium]|jgi:lipoprotein-releasing system ATP-binding protein|nr:lolD [Fusobacteriales bacterium]MDN5303256.1 lipoprotein-releasing system ATP-binding protein [Fusobacteriaceae bacterium]